ncbi:MafI family immunity protein [Longitalea luteola]|uniref:MafI family immunity protein n=1 Tax=Longitalea luteola TaxID=2812563 RepID=UPI001A964A50|nr:MafI family immunity protein [Longitalea luteola]
MEQLLTNIINKAALFGLPPSDISNAKEFLDHHEYALCLETITVQLYENEIRIDNEFYQLVVNAAKKMKASISDFDYIISLIG